MATAKPAPKDKSLPPIVIKRVKKAAHGHHGGVWKIAYADFVTAMMAFFLLMWVLGSTTTGDLAGISAYFQNPLRVSIQGGQGSGDATRPMKGGGENLFRTSGQEARADSLSNQRRVSDSSTNDEQARLEQERMESAKQAVESQMEADPALAQLRNQVFIAVGVEGLRIQIVDDKKRPMFAIGSAVPYPYTQRLLRMIGRVLSELTNQVRFEGHTDNRMFGNGAAGYGNWELSSERANAARRELVLGGMAERRTAQVSGYADSVRLNPEDASDPINRRISITVLRNKPQPSVVKSASGTQDKLISSGDSKANVDQALKSLSGVVSPSLPAQAASAAVAPPSVSVPKPPVLSDGAPSQGAGGSQIPASPNGMAYQLPPRPGMTLPGAGSR